MQRQTPNASARTLALFAPDPIAELERAKKVASEIPLHAHFVRHSKGSKFWVARWTTEEHQRVRKYVGDDAQLAKVKRAHDLVRGYLIAHGLPVPRVRRRRKTTTTQHRAPSPGHKSPTAPGGGSRLAAQSLRHSDQASNGEGVRSSVAASGSRRRN
jgi:hypothetical protein